MATGPSLRPMPCIHLTPRRTRPSAMHGGGWPQGLACSQVLQPTLRRHPTQGDGCRAWPMARPCGQCPACISPHAAHCLQPCMARVGGKAWPAARSCSRPRTGTQLRRLATGGWLHGPPSLASMRPQRPHPPGARPPASAWLRPGNALVMLGSALVVSC